MFEKQNWKLKFFMVTLGQAVSMLGSHGVQFALIWWLAEQTSSPFMLGLSGLVAYLPMSLFSPLAGVAADRLNRKWVCIVSDMAMGLMAAAYALCLAFFDLPAWTVLLMLGARGAGNTFQQPAIQSIIPQLAPADQLVKTNGWMQLLNAGSFLLGPVIGAALYAALPLSAVLLSDVAGAVFASAMLAVVPVPELKKKEERPLPITAQVREGLEVFRKDRELFFLVIAEALCMFFYAPLSSFYPLMTSSYFCLSAMHGSAVELSFAVGMLLSSLLFSSVMTVKRKLRASYLGLAGIGLMSALGGMLPPTFSGWLLFAAVCVGLGAFGNVHSIPLTAYIQETVEPEKMGRAFSMLTLISSVTMPVGLLFSSPIAEALGVSSWFFLSGAAILFLTGAVLLVRRAHPSEAFLS